MPPIMPHGGDSSKCEDVGHAARLNKEDDAGAEFAAGLDLPNCTIKQNDTQNQTVQISKTT